MNIIRNKTIDISYKFNEIFAPMKDCNYVVNWEIIKFGFDNLGTFNLENLREIVSIESYNYVDGTISVSYIEKVFSVIFDAIAFQKTKGTLGYELNTHDKLFIVKIEQLFWSIVKKNFEWPPTITYFHDANTDSYFDLGFMWNFCFILLNNKDEGILLSAGASD